MILLLKEIKPKDRARVGGKCFALANLLKNGIKVPATICLSTTAYEEYVSQGGLQERITTTNKGSITSVQAIYVPADDLTDPAPATSFAHLDATTTLSRAISEKGIYPAVDPLDSNSRMLDPRIVGEEHYAVARQVQEILQQC